MKVDQKAVERALKASAAFTTASEQLAEASDEATVAFLQLTAGALRVIGRSISYSIAQLQSNCTAAEAREWMRLKFNDPGLDDYDVAVKIREARGLRVRYFD